MTLAVTLQEEDLNRLKERLKQVDPEKANVLESRLQGLDVDLASKQPKTATKGRGVLKPKKKAKLSLKEVVTFLTRSPFIRCLAVMALAQGLSTNLLDVAWKSHLHMLHPSPAAYSVSPLSLRLHA